MREDYFTSQAIFYFLQPALEDRRDVILDVYRLEKCKRVNTEWSAELTFPGHVSLTAFAYGSYWHGFETATSIAECSGPAPKFELDGMHERRAVPMQGRRALLGRMGSEGRAAGLVRMSGIHMMYCR